MQDLHFSKFDSEFCFFFKKTSCKNVLPKSPSPLQFVCSSLIYIHNFFLSRTVLIGVDCWFLNIQNPFGDLEEIHQEASLFLTIKQTTHYSYYFCKKGVRAFSNCPLRVLRATWSIQRMQHPFPWDVSFAFRSHIKSNYIC